METKIAVFTRQHKLKIGDVYRENKNQYLNIVNYKLLKSPKNIKNIPEKSNFSP